MPFTAELPIETAKRRDSNSAHCGVDSSATSALALQTGGSVKQWKIDTLGIHIDSRVRYDIEAVCVIKRYKTSRSLNDSTR